MIEVAADCSLKLLEDEFEKFCHDIPVPKKLLFQYEKDLRKNQADHDELMKVLPELNFKNMRKVLTWLKNYALATEMRGIKHNSKEVAQVFIGHGYKTAAEVKIELDPAKRKSLGKYIVAEILSCLLEGSGHIYQALIRMAKEWLRKTGDSPPITL